MKPPIAEQRLHRETHHGIVKDDPYAWLRDDNWQQVMHEPDCLDGDIRAYLEAENAYTEYNLEPLFDMRDRLFAEMRGRIEPNETTIPQTHGAFAWNTRYREGDEHPMICRDTQIVGRPKQMSCSTAISLPKDKIISSSLIISPQTMGAFWLGPPTIMAANI